MAPHVSVSKILVHPIKSCRGISVESSNYTPEGLEYDRIWCIIDAEKLRVITARDVPKMILITPFIDGETLKITFPKESGCEDISTPLHPTEDILKSWSMLPKIVLWPTSDPLDGYICLPTPDTKGDPSTILSQYMERPVHLVYKGPQPRAIDPTSTFPNLEATAKYQDMYPLLVLSEESTFSVDQQVKRYIGQQGIEEKWETETVSIERFRPNIILRGGGPFAEDNWEEITIGSSESPRITLVSKCVRCLLPNVSPETGIRDVAVPYKVLMKFRIGMDPTEKMKPCVGSNGVPVRSGVVNVGDRVYVKKMI